MPIPSSSPPPLLPSPTPAQTLATARTRNHLRILILNARTNQPVPNERLNIAFRPDQIGSVALPTDKNGLIDVDLGAASTIRILANMYADCRPRAELYTDYPIATIQQSGLTTGNLCSAAHPASRPGTLTLYVIPKTFVPAYPQPPNTNLPHSDENPHTQPN